VLLLGMLARRRAGRPVRWVWLLSGALCLHGAVLVLALVAPGASLGTFYAVLLRRNEAAFAEADLFRATWELTLFLSLGSVALGAALAALGIADLREQGPVKGEAPAEAPGEKAEKAPPAGRLETLWAIVGVTVVPVVLFGRMEGNTGAVVLLSLLCCSLALFAGFVTRRATARRR
jgi:hypothetical protein